MRREARRLKSLDQLASDLLSNTNAVIKNELYRRRDEPPVHTDQRAKDWAEALRRKKATDSQVLAIKERLDIALKEVKRGQGYFPNGDQLSPELRHVRGQICRDLENFIKHFSEQTRGSTETPPTLFDYPKP